MITYLQEAFYIMTVSIAINGFGRIGRMVFRQAIVQDDLNISGD